MHFWFKISVVFLFLTAPILAYDRLQDVRYNLLPQWKSDTKMQVGVGMRTSFDSDPCIPIGFSAVLGKYLELGTKILIDDWKGHFDVGGKVYFKNGAYIALDGWFGINHDNGGAFAASYGNRRNIAKNFYTDYEVRAAVGDAVVYPDGLFKIAASAIPTLRFGEPVIVSIEVNTSGSVAEINNDFLVDLIPRLEIKLGNVSVRSEYNIAILQEDINNTNLAALYVIYGF